MAIAGIKRLDSLADIKGGNYVGYYWLSGEENPIMIRGSFEPTLTDESLFVVEAMLWDETNKQSIIITNTGRYQIFEYNLNQLPKNAVLECKAYMPHRLTNVKTVQFKQLWLPEKDENCCDMEVLKLKAQIFVGF
jgi:CRISPR type III-associated protein (TIGR04423 family)